MAHHQRSTMFLKEVISKSVEKAVCQLHHDASTQSSTVSLRETICSSIVFPNKETNIAPDNKLSGKPYNIEVRVALKMYHQWRRSQQSADDIKENDEKKGAAATSNEKVSQVLTITSDLRLDRHLSSPKEFAELIAPLVEEDIRTHSQWGLVPDVRCQPSGILSLITWSRFQALRTQCNLLPCPKCIQWCKGEKGMWWHQQLHHQQQHEHAAAVAQAISNNEFTIVLYNGSNNHALGFPSVATAEPSITQQEFASIADPIQCIQNGDLATLHQLVHSKQWDPVAFVDRKGATSLMWAAGGGHLDIVKYLLESCCCDPMQPQRGKRSFAGRTALHWAARNGHLMVVQYLVESTSNKNDKQQLLEVATQDGTTAFGWACWQRHMDVMQFLHQQGCTLDGVNSFGCSPVLWCSQGSSGDGLAALQWLKIQGCYMRRVNNNGHGVLHKAAQRGQHEVAEWFVKECIGEMLNVNEDEIDGIMALVGPDIEGYCPSDLAGVEGHEEFAKFLASVEIDVCTNLRRLPSYRLPRGIGDGVLTVYSPKLDDIMCIWEKYGGFRRMNSCLRG